MFKRLTQVHAKFRPAAEAVAREGWRRSSSQSFNRAPERWRKDEEQLRFLFEATNIMPWEADGETWLFTYVGEQALKILGYPDGQWSEPDFWTSHIHPADLESAVSTCRKYSQALDHFEFEYRMLAADGQVVWIHDLVSVIREDGRPKTLRGFMLDITERRRTEEALHDLGGRLINAQEAERSRLARELHDDLSQRLALLSVELEQLGQNIPTRRSNLRTRLQDLWAKAQEISVEMHRLSHQLHPSTLEHLGLTAAVESFCRELTERQGIKIEFHNRGVPTTLPTDSALCLFRIVQESLRNAVKHSGAQEAQVTLGTSGHNVYLSVADTGVGFDVNSATPGKGLGLTSMRERVRLVGGWMSLHSAPSRGTRLEIRIPLAQPGTNREVSPATAEAENRSPRRPHSSYGEHEHLSGNAPPRPLAGGLEEL